MPKVVTNNEEVFESIHGESLLDAATRAGVNLPYSCRTGRCSACKCKVTSGETSALQRESGLSDQELSEGWILSCVRTAETDLSIVVGELEGSVLPPIRTLPCRISAIEKLCDDVMRVSLRLPPAADFQFLPGQYIEIFGAGGIHRSYSLANSDLSSGFLELHIRSVKDGALSRYWFENAKTNDLLRLRGPLGTFFLRNPFKADVYFLATGTGFAPVKAMLESIQKNKPGLKPNSVTVFWGARKREDLYFDVTKFTGDFRFVPVLSKGTGDWVGARGYVQDILVAEKVDFSNATVYACGSDTMIHNARESLILAGLSRRSFYSDAFVCSGPT